MSGTIGQIEHESTVNNNEEVKQLQHQVQNLHKEVDGVNILKVTQAQIETIRDRTLKKLKVGRQSSAGKAIDTFIKELKKD